MGMILKGHHIVNNINIINILSIIKLYKLKS